MWWDCWIWKITVGSLTSHWLGQERAGVKSQRPDLTRSSMYAAGSQNICPQIITWKNSSSTVEKSDSIFLGKAKLVSPVRVK